MTGYMFDLERIFEPSFVSKIQLPNRLHQANPRQPIKLTKLKVEQACEEYKKFQICSSGLNCQGYHEKITFADIKWDLCLYGDTTGWYIKSNQYKGCSHFFLHHVIWICKRCEAFNCFNVEIVSAVACLVEEVNKYTLSNVHWSATYENLGKSHTLTSQHDLEYIVSTVFNRILNILLKQKDFAASSDKKSEDLNIDRIINSIISIRQHWATVESNLYSSCIAAVPTFENHMCRSIAQYVDAVNQSNAIKSCIYDSIIATLETVFTKAFPYKATLVVYGSVANSLGSSDSDLDLSLSLNKQVVNSFTRQIQSETIKNVNAKRVLYACKSAIGKFAHAVFSVEELLAHARIPVMRITHISTNTKVTTLHCIRSCLLIELCDSQMTSLQVDICVYNEYALRNTQMIRELAHLDPRARSLMLAVKHWASRRG